MKTRWYSHLVTKTSRKRRLLQVHSLELESREVPVVGAFTEAPLVGTGEGYDGVALLEITDAAGGGSGTGSLLKSGSHILTAAHLVADETGALTATSTDVIFRLNDGIMDRDILLKVPTSRISLGQNYNGYIQSGRDLAVLTIPDQTSITANRWQIAPFGAERYGLYTATNEIGQVFTAVGYGRTGVGQTGSERDTNGLKRQGQNRFDADANLLSTAPFESPAPQAGTALAWDFDNGLTENDAFGQMFGLNNLGLGNTEANPAQGDSGGPLFVGNQIAGIVSYSDGGVAPPDLNEDIDRGFGEYGIATRVSAYQQFINSQMSEDHQLVLDMNYQLLGLNQLTDTYTIQITVEQNELVITVQDTGMPQLDGEYYRGDLNHITGLILRGSADNETFDISPPVRLPITIVGRGGTNTLAINSTNRNHWNITGMNAGTTLNGNLRFSQVQSLQGGEGQDVFRFSNLGRLTGKISSTAVASRNVISSPDILDYSLVQAAVQVNLREGTASRVGQSVEGLRHVIGSAVGGDYLSGADSGSILIGHGRRNVLLSNGGNNILVGGMGANTLIGGLGQDLLIAGRITAESNLDALNTIFDIWQDDEATYEKRVDALLYGRLNSAEPRLILNRTVFLNPYRQSGPRFGTGSIVNSTLFGKEERDWFWTLAPQLIRNRARGEYLNTVAPLTSV